MPNTFKVKKVQTIIQEPKSTNTSQKFSDYWFQPSQESHEEERTLHMGRERWRGGDGVATRGGESGQMRGGTVAMREEPCLKWWRE